MCTGWTGRTTKLPRESHYEAKGLVTNQPQNITFPITAGGQSQNHCEVVTESHGSFVFVRRQPGCPTRTARLFVFCSEELGT